ncbi:ribonuclease J [Bryobacter aggregatus]|uniref:ribonuclease J n=1 Tax=Bryobacter aggregatus TaxID=360054 RepID=UPI0004E0D1DB|nr:ribonuclease J [Bryobacter aggregatus]
MPTGKLQVIPLGGLGEFGMNSMALRYEDDIIVIDAGMMFPDSELLGVDIVTPDFSYLKDHREKVRALILTHGHEDHIGGVPYLISQVNIPVYGTPFTLAMAERRLEEHHLLKQTDLREVEAGGKFEIGPFKIHFIRVTHSIPSTVALAITTPLGVVLHTADFKIDQTPIDDEHFDLHAFAEYGKRGVLLLMSDSTNVERTGYSESERAVRPRLEQIFATATKRLIFSTFSSSIHRLQQIMDVAKKYDRKVAFLGRSMLATTELSHELGLLHIPDNILLRPQDIMDTPAHRLCCVVSGTQGEPMSSLSRVAVDNHKSLSVKQGDTVVLSSRIIPGNEKPIGRLMNHFARRGAEIIYGGGSPPIHVSGHGYREELKLILNLVRPKYFMPVHGEYLQLIRHAQLASHLVGQGLESTFIVEDGESLMIDERGARKGEKINAGRICIDSGSLGDVVEDMIIRDRRHLSEDGFVIIVIGIDQGTGQMQGPPELISRGFVSLEESSELLPFAKQVVIKTIEASNAEERKDWGVMKEKIRNDLKRFLNRETKRRPMIVPVVLEV